MPATSEFKEGRKFLKDLENHNDREWFKPRKHIYDATVRDPMLELIVAVHRRMLKFAPAFVDDPKKCLYRIYRDIRFSKNQAPYKTHAAAQMWHRGLGKEEGAGFYFSISPHEIAIGAGLYSPSPDALRAVRNAIASDPAEFRATFAGKKISRLLGDLTGATTTRMPKGFDPAHPAADLLKRKQLMFYKTIQPEKPLADEIATRFAAATPLVEYLNRPILQLARSSR